MPARRGPLPPALKQALEQSRVIAVLEPTDFDRAWYLHDEIARAVEWVRRDPGRWTLAPIWRQGSTRDPSHIPYGLAHLNWLDGRAGPDAAADAVLALVDALPVGV